MNSTMLKHLILTSFFFLGNTIDFALGAVEEAVANFFGSNAEAADDAYEELVLLQDSVAIGHLLANGPASLLDPYSGFGFNDDRSSVVRTTEAPLGVMALYLIDAILFNSLTPYLAPILRNDAGGDETAALSIAATAYYEWWENNEELSLEDLRALPHPLQNSSSAVWLPSLSPPVEEEGTTRRRHRQLPEMPNSSTPLKIVEGGKAVVTDTLDGPDPDAVKDPSQLVFEPKNPGGPVPYNCLAWALGKNDRWLQPGKGDSWEQILMDYDYDTTPCPSCDDECPPGLGPKIKMIFHFRIPEIACKDHNWVHAMRKEPDGEWTSKNGPGPLYKDEEDCEAFLNDHYRLGFGFRREVKCFCKKDNNSTPQPTPEPIPLPTPVPTPRPIEVECYDICTRHHSYEFAMSEMYGFMCEDEGDTFQLDGHATILCDTQLTGDVLAPGDPLPNGDGVGLYPDEELCYAAMYWVMFQCSDGGLAVAGDSCTSLVSARDAITIGEVCKTVAGDNVEVSILISGQEFEVDNNCCLKETHICNYPMEMVFAIERIDPEDCFIIPNPVGEGRGR